MVERSRARAAVGLLRFTGRSEDSADESTFVDVARLVAAASGSLALTVPRAFAPGAGAGVALVRPSFFAVVPRLPWVVLLPRVAPAFVLPAFASSEPLAFVRPRALALPALSPATVRFVPEDVPPRVPAL